MSNNSTEFIAQIKSDLIASLKKNEDKLKSDIDELQQDTIEDFKIPDSGFLSLKTFTKFNVNLSSDIIAEANFTTRGVKYAQFVVDGDGTNKSYGQRNYLETARNQTLQLVKSEKVTRVFKKGGKNKGKRIYAKRTF